MRMKLNKKSMASMLMACLSALIVGGCESSAPTCWSKPIRPHPDTVFAGDDEREILTHNEKGARLCGWKP